MINHIDEMNAYLEKREKQFGMNFGLERMHELVRILDIRLPEMKFVHIAGTNGKGSTLHFLEGILSQHGLTVSAFTSPHIETMMERITYNQEYIPEEDFLRIFNGVVSSLEQLEREDLFPTQFEILTIIALLYFQEKRPDIILMETGLGGRLDSTNVIDPLLSVITNISLDHTNILGDDIKAIAFEKAGIIKKDRITVTGAKQPEALDVIREKADKQNNCLYILGTDMELRHIRPTEKGEYFDFAFRENKYEDLSIEMLGKHQVENASLAVTSAILLQPLLGFKMEEARMRDGLKKAVWKGRMEIISTNPLIMVDGSHNEEGVRALSETLRSRFSGKRLVIVMATLADKDNAFMVSELEKIADDMIFTEFDMERALAAEDLAAYSTFKEPKVEKNWRKALEDGLSALDENTMLVATGSLYFLQRNRLFLQNR